MLRFTRNANMTACLIILFFLILNSGELLWLVFLRLSRDWWKMWFGVCQLYDGRFRVGWQSIKYMYESSGRLLYDSNSQEHAKQGLSYYETPNMEAFQKLEKAFLLLIEPLLNPHQFDQFSNHTKRIKRGQEKKFIAINFRAKTRP
jgi:hypothetical protein